MIDTLRKSNPRLVVEQFMDHILPYEKQILECNQDFFLNFENNMNLNNDKMLFGLKLKNMWLSNNNKQDSDKTLRQKATVFHYFGKLLKIGHTIV